MKVISGGQTGADQIGLKVAKDLGIDTGGVCPLGWRTEDGPNKELLEEYGLIQHNSNQYAPRTEMNVINAQCTLLFGDMDSPGSKQTLAFISKHKRYYAKNPNRRIVAQAFRDFDIINIAGNRGSKLSPERQQEIYNTLKEGIEEVIVENVREGFNK